MTLNSILVDSSFLIALYDEDATSHKAVREIARLYRGQLLIPQVILTEVVYLMKREQGVEGAANFLDALTRSAPVLQDVTISDLQRAEAIMRQYSDARFDFVDCCIMALSERLKITEVCTLDRRDFSIFRPTHCDFLEILP
jgi:hypothetical protein